MKGVIKNFKNEEGFGFIIDENYEERFFHISEVNNRKRFLESIGYYVHEYNEGCYLVDFFPDSNEKGLAAKYDTPVFSTTGIGF